jgi:hypothetical protein
MHISYRNVRLWLTGDPHAATDRSRLAIDGPGLRTRRLARACAVVRVRDRPNTPLPVASLRPLPKWSGITAQLVRMCTISPLFLAACPSAPHFGVILLLLTLASNLP